MPLIVHKKVLQDCELGIWKIEESSNFFENHLSLSNEDKEWLDGVNKKRKIEWLSSRFLLKKLFSKGAPLEIFKDSNGKPHFVDQKAHLSISHSHGYVAVCKSTAPCGIDIQKEVARIKMIQHKFLSENELGRTSTDSLQNLNLLWSSKEAVFKAFGRKKISLRKHIEIDTFLETPTQATAQLQNELSKHQYSLWMEYIDNYALVVAQEI